MMRAKRQQQQKQETRKSMMKERKLVLQPYTKWLVGVFYLAGIGLILNCNEVGLTARTLDEWMPHSPSSTATSTTTMMVTVMSTTTLGSGVSGPSDPAPSHAWCVIDDNTMSPFFGHFPHTLQSLAPCWSYFTAVRDRYNTGQAADEGQEDKTKNVVQCGIFLNSTRLRWSQVHRWSRDLVDAMNCSVVHEEPPTHLFQEHWHAPLVDNRSRTWFHRSSDADRLRDQVLGAAHRRRRGKGNASRNEEPETETIESPRIGIIQRTPSRDRPGQNRIILNMEEIVRAVQVEFPLASVVLTNMSGYTMLEQARWWNDKDVIILAHGAAMTNLVFMEDSSAVVEIFPDMYNPYEFYYGLAESSGVRPPYAIFRNTRATEKYNRSPRQVDLLPNVTEVVSLVKDALENKPPRQVRCELERKHGCALSVFLDEAVADLSTIGKQAMIA